MDIRIGKYLVKSDAYNCWIEEEHTRKSKTGENKVFTTRVAGYVGSFEQLLTDFFDYKTRESNAREVKEFLKDVKAARNEVIELIKGLKK